MTAKEQYHPVRSLFLSGAVDRYTVWYTTPDGKFDSGYYVDKGPFAVSGEIVNYAPKPQKIFISIEYEWLPGKVGSGATSTLLSVANCDRWNPGYPVGHGPESTKSMGYPVLQDGTIINIRGV